MTYSCEYMLSVCFDLPAVKFGFVNWVRLSNKEAEKVLLKYFQGSLYEEKRSIREVLPVQQNHGLTLS